MRDQIHDVMLQGYTPGIYIAPELIADISASSELTRLVTLARIHAVTVYTDSNINQLVKVYKPYVFRYGTLPIEIEAKVLSNSGVIVPGGLTLPVRLWSTR